MTWFFFYQKNIEALLEEGEKNETFGVLNNFIQTFRALKNKQIPEKRYTYKSGDINYDSRQVLWWKMIIVLSRRGSFSSYPV